MWSNFGVLWRKAFVMEPTLRKGNGDPNEGSRIQNITINSETEFASAWSHDYLSRDNEETDKEDASIQKVPSKFKVSKRIGFDNIMWTVVGEGKLEDEVAKEDSCFLELYKSLTPGDYLLPTSQIIHLYPIQSWLFEILVSHSFSCHNIVLFYDTWQTPLPLHDAMLQRVDRL